MVVWEQSVILPTDFVASHLVSQFISQSTPSSEGLREHRQGKAGKRNVVRSACGSQSWGPGYGRNLGLIRRPRFEPPGGAC